MVHRQINESVVISQNSIVAKLQTQNIVINFSHDMREALYFKKYQFFSILSYNLARCSLMTFPATLNSLSDGTEVGRWARYIWATLDDAGYLILLCFHQIAGSSHRFHMPV